MTMTVANEQSAPQTEAEAIRRAAEIYRDAGIRYDDEMLRAAAEAQPEIFAGIRDALGELEAGG